MKRIVLLACLMLSLILTLPVVAFAEAPAFSEGEFFEILEEAEALAVLYTELVGKGVIGLEKLIELMSVNPAKRFGLECGIAEGST